MQRYEESLLVGNDFGQILVKKGLKGRYLLEFNQLFKQKSLSGNDPKGFINCRYIV
jgi:hypothetical protein